MTFERRPDTVKSGYMDVGRLVRRESPCRVRKQTNAPTAQGPGGDGTDFETDPQRRITIDLGKRLGMPQRTISNYENEISRIPSNLLPKFAAVLRASVAELLGQRPTPGADKDREIWKFVNQVEALPPKDKRAVFRYVEALSGANGDRATA